MAKKTSAEPKKKVDRDDIFEARLAIAQWTVAVDEAEMRDPPDDWQNTKIKAMSAGVGRGC